MAVDSIRPFDDLFSEIEQGLYTIRTVITLDGAAKAGCNAELLDERAEDH